MFDNDNKNDTTLTDMKSTKSDRKRSKREDIDDLGHFFTGIPTTEESWCVKCGEEDHVIKLSMMRCSEHYRDIVRLAEKI